jgi:hypothetical protein
MYHIFFDIGYSALLNYEYLQYIVYEQKLIYYLL